jgi:hypothetical protein
MLGTWVQLRIRLEKNAKDNILPHLSQGGGEAEEVDESHSSRRLETMLFSNLQLAFQR